MLHVGDASKWIRAFEFMLAAQHAKKCDRGGTMNRPGLRGIVLEFPASRNTNDDQQLRNALRCVSSHH